MDDLEKATIQVCKKLPWVSRHPINVKEGLTQMAFQLGIRGLLGFKKSLPYIEAGKMKKAALELKLSAWYEQTRPRAQRVIYKITRYHV